MLRQAEQKQIVEWQTKSLGVMLAATAQVDDKGYAKLLGMIEGWSLFGVKAEEKKPIENQPGSFEKLMAGLGNMG